MWFRCELIQPLRIPMMPRHLHSRTTILLVMMIKLLYSSRGLKVEISLLVLKFLTTSMICFFKMTLTLTDILNGTFSEQETQRNIIKSSLIFTIYLSVIHFTTMACESWLFLSMQRRKRILGGTVLEQTFLTFRIITKKKMYDLLAITILLHLLIPLSMMMTKFTLLIASHIPTLIFKMI